MSNKLVENRFVTVVAAAAVVGVVGAGAGYAAGQITSADIQNDTIRSKDVKDGSLKTKDLRSSAVKELQGATGPAGPAGPQGPQGPSGTATYAGPNWSIVDRNVEENGASYLRSGPGTPPKGVGSLGMRTGGGGVDKAAFGNQVDFVGDDLDGITTVKYSVYTTGENVGNGADNGPSVAFEIDPTGSGSNTAPNFSTLVYVPTGLTAEAWTQLDATAADRWFLTGGAGTASGCTQASYCTLAEVKAFYTNATLLTVQLTKGRDVEYSGAVDALVLNGTTYDFEPFGVTETTS